MCVCVCVNLAHIFYTYLVFIKSFALQSNKLSTILYFHLL